MHKFDHAYVASVLKAYPNKFKGVCLANPTLGPEGAATELAKLHSQGTAGFKFLISRRSASTVVARLHYELLIFKSLEMNAQTYKRHCTTTTHSFRLYRLCTRMPAALIGFVGVRLNPKLFPDGSEGLMGSTCDALCAKAGELKMPVTPALVAATPVFLAISHIFRSMYLFSYSRSDLLVRESASGL